MQTRTSKWNYHPTNDLHDFGAEIDLVIDRADQCLNLCEIKFYEDKFLIDKEYMEKLQKKRSCFERVTNTKKSTFLTLITAYGVNENEYYHSTVDQALTMDALFR